jgi:ferric-dicitrate binding protein FerR (iron transport regulator)
MDKNSLENYTVEDFIADESFINYHFRLNENDRNFWEEWLIKHPSKQRSAKEASELLQSLSLTLTDEEYQQELHKIKEAVDKDPKSSVFKFLNWNGRPEITRKKFNIKYIAIFLIAIAGAAYLLTISSNKEVKEPDNTIASGNKQVTLTLADSTIVTLAPNSMLQFPKVFTGKNRQVHLTGEAAFQVKRNDQFPFKVHTKNIVATVLGTIFKITKPGDSVLIIQLLEGKLKVEVKDSTRKVIQPIFLSPEEKAIYIFRDKNFYKKTNATRFDLSFQKDSFEEIANQIKTAFGIIVINQSNKRNWRFTGEFRNATIEEVISNICLVKDLTSHTKADTIYIKN